MDDTQLGARLRDARSGDAAAVAGVESAVRELARQVCGRGAQPATGGIDWEDVAQDALLRLLSSDVSYRGSGSARGYLYAAVKTSLLQTLRSARRRRAREERYSRDEPGPGGSGLDPAPIEDAVHSRRVAQEALGGLDPECRRLVEEVFLRGASYARLAADRGIAESSVRSQVSRCLRRARERSQ